MTEETQELLIERAKMSWVVPILVTVLLFGFGWVPGTERLPISVFKIVGLARIIVICWGFTRAISSLKYRKSVPGISGHAIAGIVVCGIPLILGIVLFFYLIFIPAGVAPFGSR